MVDNAFDGILVTDQSGRVFYANATYLDLIGAADGNDVRPIERVFIGDPDVSESIYRLLKAAREGRRLQEEVRIAGAAGATGALAAAAGAAARRRQARRAHDGVVDRRRDARARTAGKRVPGTAARHRLSRPRAGRLLLGRCAGDIVYLNATLAAWLDHDLAQVGVGSLKLTDIVAGEGAALLTTLNAAPGEVKTEVLDLDLQDPRRQAGAGAAVP